MRNLVDYKWLKKNLDKENLIILDVRQDTDELKGEELYKKEHIKGAQYVSGENFVLEEIGVHGGRSPMPPIEIFVENMKKFGITDDSIVVIYDDGNISVAGRLWWMLKYIGKDNIFVLKGGMDKWKDEGGDTTEEIPQVEKSKSLSININEDIKVDMEYIKKAINNKKTALVDARAYERYIGKVEPLDRIPGHIPQALNYPWTELVENKEVISLDKAKEYFKELEDYEEIIVYCGSGITATVNILLMEEVGLKPKHYSGGYSDWVSYEDNEVKKGK